MGAHFSVLVLTYNEERNLEECLRSVCRLSDDIHVVDSGSTDLTVAVARRYTDCIHHHEYLNHSGQLSWALTHVPFTHDWLFLLDADNVVSERLERQIEALDFERAEPCAYFVGHRYLFRGAPVRGFKPWSLRLFRRSRVSVDPTELVDFRFVVRGRTGRLSGEIIESNRNEDDLDFWIDKHQRFSTRLAVEEVLRGAGIIQSSVPARLLGSPDERMVWLKQRWHGMPLFLRAVGYFVYRYIVRLGFLDGRSGLVYHVSQALWYRLLVDAKIADLTRRLAAGECTLTELAARYRLDTAPAAQAGAVRLPARS